MQKRLPFDRDRMPAGQEPPQPARRDRKRHAEIAESSRLTVSQLAELIKSTLEQHITSPIRVIGEVSNLSKRGHWYFSLKDDAAVVSCVAWSSSVRRFSFEPTDGMEVIATGSVSHFPPQGRTQLYVTNLKPVGAGALDAKFRQLCDELRHAGYFDSGRKKPLPVLPRRVAVITSSGSAAVQDVITTAARRMPAVGLAIVDVRVQGDGAAKEVARAIRWVDQNANRLGVDAMLITRGGGSLEDLWTFNERIVADAVFACSLPVVAAIGHESDTTIVELVADMRGATPTQAAMLLVPERTELARQALHLQDRLRATMRHRTAQASRHIDSLSRHEIFRRPGAITREATGQYHALLRELHHAARHRVALAQRRINRLSYRFMRSHPHAVLAARRERLAVLADRLTRGVRRRVEDCRSIDRASVAIDGAILRHIAQKRAVVASLDRQLHAIDPRLVLQRGYSLTTLPNGQLVRSAHHLEAGATIDTTFSDGIVRSVVGGKRPRQPKRGHGSDQMDLFGLTE